MVVSKAENLKHNKGEKGKKEKKKGKDQQRGGRVIKLLVRRKASTPNSQMRNRLQGPEGSKTQQTTERRTGKFKGRKRPSPRKKRVSEGPKKRGVGKRAGKLIA